MPRFSIVITTTRPRLVVHALRSALAQTYADFEVIVSDNSDDGCEGLVRSFADPRVCYVRPENRLTVVPHWNFAFSHARGDWRLLLCDDDAIVPELLAILDREIAQHPEVDSICWRSASYGGGDAPQPELRHSLGIPAFTGARTINQTSDLIAQMFACGTGVEPAVKRFLPLTSYAAYSDRVLNRVTEYWSGDHFLPICPMTSSVLAILAFSTYSLRVDLPLRVMGQTVDSAGAHLWNAEYYERMHRGTEFQFAPLKTMAIFPSIAVESLLRAQAALAGKGVDQHRIDWANYFLACRRVIGKITSLGFATRELETKWAEALDGFPDDVQARVAAQLAVRTVAAPEGAVMRLRHRFHRWRKSRSSVVSSQGGTLNTKRAGIGDIGDCTRYVNKLVCREEAKKLDHAAA